MGSDLFFSLTSPFRGRILGLNEEQAKNSILDRGRQVFINSGNA